MNQRTISSSDLSDRKTSEEKDSDNRKKAMCKPALLFVQLRT